MLVNIDMQALVNGLNAEDLKVFVDLCETRLNFIAGIKLTREEEAMLEKDDSVESLISTIKTLRTRSGLGLRDAKSVCELHRAVVKKKNHDMLAVEGQYSL